MPSVTFLGTGPGTVEPGRYQSSILFEADDQAVLLDAGEPCAQQLVSLGVPVGSLDAVLLTHAHADHVAGLPLLLQAGWLQRRDRGLPLGLPAHMAGPLQSWLRTILLPPEVTGFPLETFAWEKETAVPVGKWTVTPHETTHLNNLREKLGDPRIQAFLLDIKTSSARVVYSGDLGTARDLQPVLGEPIDVLICELAHFGIDELIKTLKGAKIETLCLTHLSASAYEQRVNIKLRCEEELPGVDEVYLPEDGERIEF